MVHLENVQKNYKQFALNCSFEVPTGRVVGLIGANGSGKSTAFKAALGLIQTDGGSVTVFDKPVCDITSNDREKIGVVLSDAGFSSYLTVKSIEKIMRSSYRDFDDNFFMEKIKSCGLPTNKKLKAFSTGMRAKLALIAAMSHRARLLILDEPTAGLDVVARDELLGMLRDYITQDEERTVLISSHISSDLENLCDELYMIHDGRIVLHEDTDVLLSNYALIKADGGQYRTLDARYLLRVKPETYGYACLTNQRQYYLDNYPSLVIEQSSIDNVIMMMIRGQAV